MKTVVSLMAAGLLASCAGVGTGSRAAGPGGVEHVVLVWLKRPGNAADRAALVAAARKFQAEIREVRRLAVGTPLASERPVVDDSFDVGFVMHFAGKADLEAYERHPVHQQAVQQTLRPLARKVVVYDVLSE